MVTHILSVCNCWFVTEVLIFLTAQTRNICCRSALHSQQSASNCSKKPVAETTYI